MVFRIGSNSLHFEWRLFRVVGECFLLCKRKYSSRLTGYFLGGTDERKERFQALYRPGCSELVCGGK
jgi:hypothetical protein